RSSRDRRHRALRCVPGAVAGLALPRADARRPAEAPALEHLARGIALPLGEPDLHPVGVTILGDLVAVAGDRLVRRRRGLGAQLGDPLLEPTDVGAAVPARAVGDASAAEAVRRHQGARHLLGDREVDQRGYLRLGALLGVPAEDLIQALVPLLRAPLLGQL